jgi:hypothetical protein
MQEEKNSYVIALSDLTQIIETLQELERMHQLNLEMLEQLDVIFRWIIDNDVPIPNSDKLVSLLTKSQSLMKELYFSSPKTLQYRTVSRRKVTGRENSREGNRIGAIVTESTTDST